MPPQYGVVSETGSEIDIWSLTNSVNRMRWISPEELEKLRRQREHKDEPR